MDKKVDETKVRCLELALGYCAKPSVTDSPEKIAAKFYSYITGTEVKGETDELPY